MSRVEAVSSKVVKAKPGVRAWLAWTLVVMIAWGAFTTGVEVRRWAWEQTKEIRFINSVSNAIEWGRYANQVGVLDLYDQLLSLHGDEGDYNGPARFALDYPPLRLFIASWWADWAVKHYPPPGGGPIVWRPDYEFTWPMLRINLVCESLAAVGMFLLVYRWMRICRLEPARRWWTWRVKDGWGKTEKLQRLGELPSTVGLVPATLAMLLLWFNPAVIWNAHVYPQWDVWLLPAFIFAAYFGLRNWWLPAGIVVGISAMTKGQILLALPLLIAWPVLMGNVAGALRLLIGLAAGVAMIIWPWMLRPPLAWDWLMHVTWGAGILAAAMMLPRRGWIWYMVRLLLVLTGAVVICWTMWGVSGEYVIPGKEWAIGKGASLVGAVAVLMAISVLGNWRWVPTLLSAGWAFAVFLCMPLLGASAGWYLVGIVYGTRHWKHLFWCHGSTLGSILENRFGWRYESDRRFECDLDLSWVPWVHLGNVPIRQVMIAMYVVALGVCVFAVVRHRRRHDPRLLLALAAPFLAAYTLLPQMIDRYMMWPAALMSAFAAISFSGLVLWLVLSVIACVMMAEYMMSMCRNTQTAQMWMPYLAPTFPDIGWGIMVLCAVVLYMSVGRSRRPLWQAD